MLPRGMKPGFPDSSPLTPTPTIPPAEKSKSTPGLRERTSGISCARKAMARSWHLGVKLRRLGFRARVQGRDGLRGVKCKGFTYPRLPAFCTGIRLITFQMVFMAERGVPSRSLFTHPRRVAKHVFARSISPDTHSTFKLPKPIAARLDSCSAQPFDSQLRALLQGLL